MRRSATQCSCANGSKQSVCSSGKANVNPHIWKSPHYIQMKRRKNTQPKTKNRHEPEAINFFFRISLFLVCEWKAHEIRIASSNKKFSKKSQLKYAYHTKFYRMGSLMIMIRLSLLLYMFIHRRWNINNVYFSVFFTSTRRLTMTTILYMKHKPKTHSMLSFDYGKHMQHCDDRAWMGRESLRYYNTTCSMPFKYLNYEWVERWAQSKRYVCMRNSICLDLNGILFSLSDVRESYQFSVLFSLFLSLSLFRSFSPLLPFPLCVFTFVYHFSNFG